MLSPSTKRNISRIIPFGVIWLVFSIVYTQLERGLLGNLEYYPSTGNPYSFTRNFIITSVAALITGLFIGMIETLYFNKWFIQKSFGKKILYKSIIYLAIIIVFLVVLTAIANSIEMHISILDQRIWSNLKAFFSNYAILSVGVYMASIIVLSQFYAEVSENLGQGVLNKFFTGKYHHPIVEERIYMFLDMKSSTTIAENLGHVRYFEMLKEYYYDMSDSIVRHSGEIYQYVGDEIIVSWKLPYGLRNNNCIQCFFSIKAAINKQKRKYETKFGLVPGFKAGFHLGKVTTGEIGVIKKDILFTGDVLNTAARIQGLCNTYGVDILVSGDLLKVMELPAHYQVTSFGENELRGRDEKIEVFTILSP